MPLTFTPSPELTLGVEVELQVLDAESRDLTPAAPQLLERLGKRPDVRPEIFQAMLEVSTPVCRSAAEARTSLARVLAEVRAAAEALGLRVAAAGSHPFAKHRDRLVSPAERYQNLIDRNRWIARRLMIFGLHVHVGMRDGPEAQAVINGLLPYLGHLLALSASSPFWQGDDTGLASSRIAIFEALPTAGHPCTFADWDEFVRTYDAMVTSGAVGSIKDIWWDVRPHPDYGTVEVRVCDGCPTLSETVAVVGLVHALCAWLAERHRAGERFRPPPEWVMRENKWRASRWGLAADLVTDATGTRRPARDGLRDLLAELAPYATRTGSVAELHAVRDMLERPPSYERQRKLLERHHSLVNVADALVQELATDSPVVAR